MLKELLEKRAEIAKDIRRLADLANDEKHAWTPEEEENWKKANTDYDALSQKIDKSKRSDAITAELEQIIEKDQPIVHQMRKAETSDEEKRQLPVTEEERTRAINAWARTQYGIELSAEDKWACQRAGLNPFAKEIELRLEKDYNKVRRELRVYGPQSTTAAEGGYTIPVGFVPRFERARLAFGGVRQVAEVIRTDSGNALHWPMTNDTGNKGALLAENTQVSGQEIVVSEVLLEAYKWSSKLIQVSAELLQDSAFDLAGVVADMQGERIGRIENDYFTTGTGSSQPQGIVTGATAFAAADDTTICSDDFLGLIHAVDPAYRGEPGAGFMMNDATLLAIRKLKETGTGRYLWEESYAGGPAGTLKGYPITVNQSMANIGASAKICLFGALRYYKIRDAGGIRVRRLVERYADYDNEGFLAFARSDGVLLDAGTHPVKVLQNLAS